MISKSNNITRLKTQFNFTSTIYTKKFFFILMFCIINRLGFLYEED